MAVEYHVKSLTALKNLFSELKSLSTTNNLNNILLLNDDLSETIKKTKQYYIDYVNKFSFSRESVELYISFIKNVLVIFFDNLVKNNIIIYCINKYIYFLNIICNF